MGWGKWSTERFGQLPPLLPWIAFALHFGIYISLASVMLIKLQGYKARDDTSPSAFRSFGRQKLRASDIISLISLATKLADVIAGFWSGMLAIRFAHVVWKKARDARPYDGGKMDKIIRWTTQYYFPPTTAIGDAIFSPQAVVIRLSLLLFGISFISAPLIEGALDWSSSSQLGEPGTARVMTGNPTAQFILWSSPSTGKKLDRQEITEAAYLAGMTWERQTTSNITELERRPCRHVTNDTPFPIGSEIHNVTVPYIIVHDISWPKAEMPPYVKTILDHSNTTSVSSYDPFTAGGDHPGIAVLFDPGNATLTLPVKFADSSWYDSYPASFRWSGTMAAIVLLSRYHQAAPVIIDPFGYQALNKSMNNYENRGTEIIVTPGEAGVRPVRTYTYLTVNFTAGVRLSSRGTYVKSNVIENDGGDPDGRDIRPGPWVQEALYMMSDVMSTIAILNTSEMATWENLFNYTEALIRYSYLSSWDVLQRRFDPNSTELTVTLREPRLQANINVLRVLAWLFLNVGFTCTALSLPFIWKDEKGGNERDVTDKVEDIADLMRKVTEYEAKLKTDKEEEEEEEETNEQDLGSEAQELLLTGD